MNDTHNAELAVTARRRAQRVTASTGTFYVALPDLDWGPGGGLVYPPERVVQVCVIGDVTSLSVCKHDEKDDKKTVTTTETEVVVDTRALLSALVSQLDADVAAAALALYRNTPVKEDPCNS